MQADFFSADHSVAYRNDVILALEQDDASAAQLAWNALDQHCPADDCLPALRVLIEALGAQSHAVFQDHAALNLARQALQNDISPAARRGMGVAATTWLCKRWKQLALRAAALAYRADHCEDHAAPLWLCAGEWQAAAEAAASIASWRRIPAPLSWMLHAQLRLHGVQPYWGLLAELAWLSPSRLRRVVQDSADPILLSWVQKFEQKFEVCGEVGADGGLSDLAWFPAWLLTERSDWAAHLTRAQASQNTPPEQAMCALLELLGLEHQGRHHDVIARRKSLRDLNLPLYAAYMASR